MRSILQSVSAAYFVFFFSYSADIINSKIIRSGGFYLPASKYALPQPLTHCKFKKLISSSASETH